MLFRSRRPRTIRVCDELPPVHFIFFDPARSAYITISSRSYKWIVTHGPDLPDYVSVKPTPKVVRDFLFTKVNAGIDPNSRLFFGSGVYDCIVALSVLLLICSRMFPYYLKNKAHYVAACRYRLAVWIASGNIRKLKSSGKTMDGDLLSKNLLHIFKTYWHDKTHDKEPDQSITEIMLSLQNKELPADIIAKTSVFFNEQYVIRFSRNKRGGTDHSLRCTMLMEIIKKLDQMPRVFTGYESV